MKINLILNDRDIQVINFLWKWKTATLAVLSVKFFQDCSERRAYNRINELRHANILDARIGIGSRTLYYTLGGKGFETVRQQHPSLNLSASKRFLKSNDSIEKEALTAAFHLGMFANETPDNTALLSKRDLEILNEENAPDWLTCPLSVKPDGIWHISNGDAPKTIALKVVTEELEEKAILQTIRPYKNSQNFDQVFFVFSSILCFIKVAALINLGKIDSPKFYFFWEGDFKKHGWNLSGLSILKNETTIAGFLGIPHENPVNTSDLFPTKWFFQNRKSSTNSALSNFDSTLKHSD